MDHVGDSSWEEEKQAAIDEFFEDCAIPDPATQKVRVRVGSNQP